MAIEEISSKWCLLPSYNHSYLVVGTKTLLAAVKTYICNTSLTNYCNHYHNSNIQQKEEGLVSSTNLFILTKKVEVNNNKYQFNNKQFNSNLST